MLDAFAGVMFNVIVSNTEDRADPASHLAAMRGLLDALMARGVAAGLRPLVLFSSGCKDYGVMDRKHGDPALTPHTEDSPLAPPDFLRA